MAAAPAARPPPSLTTLITRRFETLPPEARAVVELLALSEPLRLDEVARLTSYDGLAAAEERGLVVVSDPAGGGEVRIMHPMYSEVIRAELPVLRARVLRLRLAEAIQARQPLTPDDALRAARLLTDAGEAVPPGSYSTPPRPPIWPATRRWAWSSRRAPSRPMPGCVPPCSWRALTPSATSSRRRRQRWPQPRGAPAATRTPWTT